MKGLNIVLKKRTMVLLLSVTGILSTTRALGQQQNMVKDLP